MQLAMAGYMLWHGRWAGLLSLTFGCMFTLAAFACLLVHSDICIFRTEKHVRLSTGIGSFCYERLIRFDHIDSIRLTLMNRRSVRNSRIEIVCSNEVIECPPTDVPRQEALCLALLLNARLVKVYGYDMPEVSARLNKLTSA